MPESFVAQTKTPPKYPPPATNSNRNSLHNGNHYYGSPPPPMLRDAISDPNNSCAICLNINMFYDKSIHNDAKELGHHINVCFLFVGQIVKLSHRGYSWIKCRGGTEVGQLSLS